MKVMVFYQTGILIELLFYSIDRLYLTYKF